MTSADYYPIADYAPGERFHSLVLAIRSVKSGTSKNGAPYADLRLGDWSGTRSAKLWKITDAEIAALSQAEFLEINGEVDASERFAGDLCVHRYAIAPTPDDITPYIEQPPASNKDSQQRFVKLVKGIDDGELYNVLKRIFINDLDFRKRFFRAYAASSVHHAFPGGLLEHTVEVAELCVEASRIITGLDRDLLVAAALLHDIGKMEEMNQELRAGEYTDDGTLIGHLVLGSVRVAQAIDRHNEDCADAEKIAVKTRRALMHLILSHHGMPEYGAALKPAFAEAAVLYLCDNISAKARQHLDLVEKNTVGAVSTYHQFLGGRVYLKTPRDVASEPSGGEKKPKPLRPDFLDMEDAGKAAFVTATMLPVLGLVAAGSPDEKRDDSLALNHRRCVPPPDGADYLLEVTGDSMIGAGIQEGDLLFVKDQATAREGEIVVAHLGGEGQTVKYLRNNPKREQEIDGPFLEAANSKYKPIPITSETRIQGRVTGLLRDF